MNSKPWQKFGAWFSELLVTCKSGSCEWKLQVFSTSECQTYFPFHANIDSLTSFMCLYVCVYKCGCLFIMYIYVYSLARTFTQFIVCSTWCNEMLVVCPIKWLYLDFFFLLFFFFPFLSLFLFLASFPWCEQGYEGRGWGYWRLYSSHPTKHKLKAIAWWRFLNCLTDLVEMKGWL